MALGKFAIVAAAGAGALAADKNTTAAEWEASQAEAADARDASAAKAKKGAAVGKAVELLKSLQAKVIAEGEAEAKTYGTFSCFCKDTTKEKLDAIQRGEDEKASLSADLGALSSKRDGLDHTIQQTLQDVTLAEKDMKDARTQREETLKLYEVNSEDLKGALDALEGAIQTLKASKAPSLAQLHAVSGTLQTAALLADTLGLTGGVDQKLMAMLQQEPANGNEVRMEDYKFHSSGIIKTLESLLENFRAERVEVDKTEAASVKEFEMFMQAKTDLVKSLNHKLQAKKKEKEQTIADLESDNQRLTTVEATLLDDKEYANKLSHMCSDKARTWDQRSAVRAAELSTLTQAIGIISGVVTEKTSANTVRLTQQGVSLGVAEGLAADQDRMVSIEAAAEAAEAAPAFVQMASDSVLKAVRRLRGPQPVKTAQDMIASLLKSKGQQLKSTLLTSLASQIAKDPFAKVKSLIQELIERLLQEAGNESNQKGWCDKAHADARQKRTYAADEVRTLNSAMANLEATRDQLTEEVGTLSKDMAEIRQNRDIAENERDEESTQNKATVEEAGQGLEALNMCMDLLEKFYKTVAKGAVDLSLAQRGPADEAPDAGFGNGEAYLGAQSESGGVLAMLDVMKSDFTRTIQETEQAEEQAQQDHLEFMTESGKSLAMKDEAHKAKTEQLDDAKAKLGEAEESMGAQSELLRSSIKELLELKPVCVDTGMSYTDRVAMREDELASLNKAMCILERYAEYGPDGAAGAC